MEIFQLLRGESPRRLDTLEQMPEEGFVWLDFVRDEAGGWDAWPKKLLGSEVDRRHLKDSLEATHKSFFDITPDYDFLVFEGLGPDASRFPLETRSAAFFLYDRLLVTVRASENMSFDILRRRFREGRARSPASPRVLAQMVLDIMVDRFLGVRETFTRRLDALQEDLLDPTSPFNDWQQLLTGRREARRLESLCDDQVTALDTWHRDSRIEWSNPEETRLRDATEHIARLRHAAIEIERNTEAAVQLYFASMSHRTNEIVRTLTVFSAIFLPLTFIAGVYGMNFRYMPELDMHLAYPILLIVMTMVAGGLLLHFRRRGYF